jgi:hypothetical protein
MLHFFIVDLLDQFILQYNNNATLYIAIEQYCNSPYCNMPCIDLQYAAVQLNLLLTTFNQCNSHIYLSLLTLHDAIQTCHTLLLSSASLNLSLSSISFCCLHPLAILCAKQLFPSSCQFFLTISITVSLASATVFPSQRSQ